MHLTLKRVNRAVSAIRCLSRGTLRDIEKEEASCKVGAEWSQASATQKALVLDIWNKQRARAQWGSLTDGKAAFVRLGKSKAGVNS